jgi:hypothetical protein
MRHYVKNQDVLRVAARRTTWRWVQLVTALQVDRECNETTALRAVKRAVGAGLLVRHDGAYQVAEDATRLLDKPYRYRRLDRRRLLQIIAERPAWAYSDLIMEVCAQLGTTENTIKRSVRYGRDFGYIERLPHGGWAVTPHCRELLAMWGRLEGAEGFRFATYLSGHPKRGFKRWEDHME